MSCRSVERWLLSASKPPPPRLLRSSPRHLCRRLYYGGG